MRAHILVLLNNDGIPWNTIIAVLFTSTMVVMAGTYLISGVRNLRSTKNPHWCVGIEACKVISPVPIGHIGSGVQLGIARIVERGRLSRAQRGKSTESPATLVATVEKYTRAAAETDRKNAAEPRQSATHALYGAHLLMRQHISPDYDLRGDSWRFVHH